MNAKLCQQRFYFYHCTGFRSGLLKQIHGYLPTCMWVSSRCPFWLNLTFNITELLFVRKIFCCRLWTFTGWYPKTRLRRRFSACNSSSSKQQTLWYLLKTRPRRYAHRIINIYISDFLKSGFLLTFRKQHAPKIPELDLGLVSWRWRYVFRINYRYFFFENP